MKTVAPRGTRLDEAKAELIGAISQLPPQARFNIIAYDKRTRAWQKRGLVAATDGNKARAQKFILRMKPGSETASYDALAAALALAGATEEVFFVSDGRPTAGKIINPADIVRTITYMNFLHRVAINTVPIDAQGPAVQFMSALAADNGGSCRSAVH
jgi:hypothetical protein